MNKNKKKDKEEESNPKVYGNPEYGSGEDIYNNAENVESIEGNDNPRVEGVPKDKLKMDDFDVPGADLDDSDEFIGEEDEENNYYSLGGDDHNDLDEGEDE